MPQTQEELPIRLDPPLPETIGSTCRQLVGDAPAEFNREWGLSSTTEFNWAEILRSVPVPAAERMERHRWGICSASAAEFNRAEAFNREATILLEERSILPHARLV